MFNRISPETKQHIFREAQRAFAVSEGGDIKTIVQRAVKTYEV